MRIISKFKDYYDSAAKFGVDLSHVYLRNTQEIDNKLAKNSLKDLNLIRVIDFFRGRDSSIHLSVISGVIAFCGKAYPYLKFTYSEKTDIGLLSEKCEFAYSMNDVVEILQRLHPEYLQGNYWSRKKSRLLEDKDFNGNYRVSKIVCDHLFGGNLSENVLDKLFHEHKTPVLAIIERGRNEAISHRHKLVINPCLNDFHFMRVMDAYSANQAIDQYYFGVIGQGQNEMIEIADKYRVEKKGFDTKYGFRTRPKE